jgi:lipid A 3-O-deacylase
MSTIRGSLAWSIAAITRKTTVALSFLVGLAICPLTTPLWAQAPELNRGTWDVSLWAAGATGEENTNSFSEAQIFSAGVFVGRVLTDEIGSGWRRGRMEYGADVNPVFVQFTPQRIHGVAFDPVILRWTSSLHRGSIAPYIELGGGAIRTNSNFPVGDTSSFNFIARGGGGILIATKRAQAFEIGCRWWHISSANLGNRNPEFNGIQINVGWHWYR